jgi:hypothetical protein
MKMTILPNARPRAGSPFVRILREGVFPALRLLTRPSTLAQIPRLLGEGLAPVERMFVQAHNNREMARMVREGEAVTFVGSFGRSGNTWMRYLVSDVLLQNKGIQTTTELPIDPGKIIPDYHAQLIARRDLTVPSPSCMIKIHDSIPLLQERIGGDPAVRKCKFLYLYRTPADALVSTFHLYLREKYIPSKSGRDIDLFCLEYLPVWLGNVTSYLDDLDGGVEIHLVSYGQLLEQPMAVLSDTLRWLGIAQTDAIVARAVSNMEFKNLQKMEAKTLNGRIPFFRRGGNDSGKLELKPETYAKIREATQHVMVRADECLARQSLRNRAGRDISPVSAQTEYRNGHAEVASASDRF